MAKHYVLYHKELDRPVYPIDGSLTKKEAEAALKKQERSEELEIREVQPPEEDK